MERALTYTARNLRHASKCFFSEICLSLHNCIDCSFSFLHSCTILWYIMCYPKSIIVNYSYLVVHCPLAIQETRQPVAPYPPQRRRYLKQRRRWCCVARPSRLIGWSSWRFRPPSLREFQWIEGLGFWCCFFFLWISRNFHDFFVCFLLVWVGQVSSSVQGLCCLKTRSVCQFCSKTCDTVLCFKTQLFLHVLLLVQKVCNKNIKHMFLKVAPRFLWQHVFSGMLLSHIHQELLCHCGRPFESIRHTRPSWMRWLSFSTKPTPYW